MSKPVIRLDPGPRSDLRDLLTVIRGNAELIADDPRLVPSARAKARAIDRTVDELQKMFGLVEEDRQILQAVATAKAHNNHLGATER